MRLSALFIIIATFIAAGAVSLVTANFSVTLIEDNSEIGVRSALDDEGMPWAEVEADGLQVSLSGIAPSEALRFKALSTAGSVVDAARIIDDMKVKAIADLAPPRFSIEILRNDSGISVIGLIPASVDRADLISDFEAISDVGQVADLLETADYPVPDGWGDALAFSLLALKELPQSKVSVTAGRVTISAISESLTAKQRLEKTLKRAVPPAVQMSLAISAPRPVITPFTLRFVKDSDGALFDACSADTEAASKRILAAARAAGMSVDGSCIIGMGVPTPSWATAATQAIAAIESLGGGSVTFSDADITLIALEGTEQSTFDKVIGELEAALPSVFVLHAVLPVAVTGTTQGPPEFVATLSPEGLVQLRGRLSDENVRAATDSYAKARFGSANVYMAARIVPDLPLNWPVRILTGLEALAFLNNGAVTVTPDSVRIQGNTGDPDANALIAQLLADKLGTSEDFAIDVTYQEKLDPVASLPSSEECEAEIGEIVAANKIEFEPGSTKINAEAMGTMDDIAEILKECGDIRLEIQGHTDSQGGEEMNAQLSQTRAQSVLDELRARRVLTSSFTAKGYGETVPVADNDTEEGREANRRIEFKLNRVVDRHSHHPTGLESTEMQETPSVGETE
jgi:OOP family OmpA-OmpF porin